MQDRGGVVAIARQVKPGYEEEFEETVRGKCLFSPVEIVAHLTRSALGEAQKAG
jgi:hypothetical protein